mgnify:CR=1 FL=1
MLRESRRVMLTIMIFCKNKLVICDRKKLELWQQFLLSMFRFLWRFMFSFKPSVSWHHETFDLLLTRTTYARFVLICPSNCIVSLPSCLNIIRLVKYTQDKILNRHTVPFFFISEFVACWRKASQTTRTTTYN